MMKVKKEFLDSRAFVVFLTVALILLAIFNLIQVAVNPYILDIIGRSLRVGAIELSNGRPIYTSPALAMSYTPGYVLLNAAMFKVFGFSYPLWNVIWAFSGLSFLFGFTWYFWKVEKMLAPMVPAALLSCLFPFLWARADIYAVVFFGIGLLVLDPLLSKRLNYKREVVAIVFLGLSLFFKQTMLPIIGGAILVSANGSVFSRDNILRTVRVFSFSVLFFGLLMAVYISAFGENVNSVIEVLNLGKNHALLFDNAIRYSVIYMLITIPPCIYIWKNEPWALSRALLLLFVGSAYVLFSTKDGGYNWHHFFTIFLPWLWLIAKTRKDERAKAVSIIGKLVWVSTLTLLGLAYAYSPTVPKVASQLDALSVIELESLIAQTKPTNEFALFLDSANAFSFPEIAYVSTYKARYERGPLEEWSGAEKQIMPSLLNDLDSQLFINIYMRKGNDIGGTAYGIPYELFYNALYENYKPCQIQAEYWNILCRK